MKVRGSPVLFFLALALAAFAIAPGLVAANDQAQTYLLVSVPADNIGGGEPINAVSLTSLSNSYPTGRLSMSESLRHDMIGPQQDGCYISKFPTAANSDRNSVNTITLAQGWISMTSTAAE